MYMYIYPSANTFLKVFIRYMPQMQNSLYEGQEEIRIGGGGQGGL